MKYIAVSYKSLYAIVEAVEFKLAFDEKRLADISDENEMSDLDNDIAFANAYLSGLKRDLENWANLPGDR